MTDKADSQNVNPVMSPRAPSFHYRGSEFRADPGPGLRADVRNHWEINQGSWIPGHKAVLEQADHLGVTLLATGSRHITKQH